MTTQLDAGGPSLEDIVAGNIRAEVARAGLTQADIARALHVPRSWVSTRYRGAARWSIADVERVADLLGLPPAQLFVRQQGLEPRTRWFSGGRHLKAVA